MITFTQRQKLDLKSKLANTRIIVRGHTLAFNTEAIKWLKVYLDTGLQFHAHRNLMFEKAQKAEDKVCQLESTSRHEPGLIRKIQLVAVQVVTLYGAE